jgi:predicted dehydrogenase
MRKLRVGIIGYGFIGKVHAYGYHNLPYFFDPAPAEVTLAGVCTSRRESAEAARRQGGFEFATTEPMEIIGRRDIDIINICTPNHLHKGELLAAMAAGKHIYCDKPLTATVAEAREVAAALKGYQGVSQMTLNNRFALPAMRAKQMIEEGFVGRVTQFRGAYLHSGSVDALRPMGWKQEAEFGGGVINDLGSHLLDMAEWLAGPFVETLAEGRVLYATRPVRSGGPAAVTAEDAVTMLVRRGDGATGVLEATKIATGTNDELRMEIHGDAGALRFNTMEPNALEAYSLSDGESPMGGMRGWRRIDTVDRFPSPAGWPGPKFAVGWLRSHVQCLYNFVSAVAAGRATRPDLADGVRLQEMLEVVRVSAARREWLPLGEGRAGN